MFCWHLHVLNLAVLIFMLGFVSLSVVMFCFLKFLLLHVLCCYALLLCSLKLLHSSACDVVMVVCSIFSVSLFGER